MPVTEGQLRAESNEVEGAGQRPAAASMVLTGDSRPSSASYQQEWQDTSHQKTPKKKGKNPSAMCIRLGRCWRKQKQWRH